MNGKYADAQALKDAMHEHLRTTGLDSRKRSFKKKPASSILAATQEHDQHDDTPDEVSMELCSFTTLPPTSMSEQAMDLLDSMFEGALE